ncbi:hypothetical protein [Neomicrococcus aestuarii]|uniref:Uracil-DNA glycosylase-like domain-containing protein n=1 Tax=Neomicrococcus aestuarii TaxID=556325 RepID=A0A1L2ZQW6_9MICC|nr:hypothetical protein [Neomicrococcus aestuarii]APF41567.1 hypothetical protein BHE16_11860 [Neomicrococcus aestuarii]
MVANVSIVGWETYEALLRYPVSHPEVTEAMAARGLPVGEPEGGWRLGHTSSWARWGPRGNLLEPITARSKEEFQSLPPMTTSIMFFGLNWGGESPPVHGQDWENFHAHGHRGDTSLARAFAEATDQTGFAAASYMTDVFKLLPTKSAASLDATVRSEEKAGRDPVGRCVEIIRHEFSVCKAANDGRNPVIVGIGGAAYRWLAGRQRTEGRPPWPSRVSEAMSELLQDDAAAAVRWAPHYTFGSAKHVDRVAAISSILREAEYM